MLGCRPKITSQGDAIRYPPVGANLRYEERRGAFVEPYVYTIEIGSHSRNILNTRFTPLALN